MFPSSRQRNTECDTLTRQTGLPWGEEGTGCEDEVPWIPPRVSLVEEDIFSIARGGALSEFAISQPPATLNNV